MAFPQSAMGLPSALKYDLPPSMSDSARSYSVNVAPDGITSVAGAVGNISFSANAVTQSQFSSQVVSFTIPSGMSEAVFMDCMNTTVSFTLTYTVGTAASVTGGVCKLLSSAASWFDTLVLYSNNTPLETINQYGLLQNFLLQNTVNLSERVGGVSICMGTDSNSANGIDLPTAAGAYRFNFCIPLISLIGLNTEKYFPIGSVNNMQLQLTTANLCPIVTYCTAVATNATLTVAPTLSEFRLNMKYLDVGDQAAAMLRQTLQDGKWFIKSATYTNSAVTIPSGSSGNQQALLQIRNSSVKSVFHQFGQTNVGAPGLVSPNGAYDAINIGCTSRQLQIGGSYFPNLPINDVQRPAEGYAVLIQALGGSIPKAYGTTVTREMYSSVGGIAAVPSGADNGLVLPAANSRAAPAGSDQSAQAVTNFPSGHFLGYDLEKVGGILFSGLNTRAAPPFLNLFLGSALNANVTTQAWGLSDIVVVVDTVSKSIQAFI